MENNSEMTPSQAAANQTGITSRFMVGFLAGIAASFVFIFVFMSLFTSNILNYGGQKDTAKAGTANPTQEAPQAPDPKIAIAAAAKAAGVDAEAVQSCVDSGKFKQSVQDEEDGGAGAGVQGTPNNIILYGNMVTQLPGAMPLANFETMIDNYLNGNGSKNEQAKITVPPVTSGDWVRGDKNAKLTIIEYTDIDCPFCRRHHSTMLQLMDKYEGKIRWVYRHFPLDALHPNARMKAEASECAADLGGEEAFWKYIDAIYED